MYYKLGNSDKTTLPLRFYWTENGLTTLTKKLPDMLLNYTNVVNRLIVLVFIGMRSISMPGTFFTGSCLVKIHLRKSTN